MTSRTPLAALLVAAALGLAACGDDSGDETATTAASPAEAEAAIEEAWAAFIDALEQGDGEAACAELSARMAEPNELNRQLGAPLPGGPACEEVAGDKNATLSFLAGTGPDFVELEVEGETANGIAGAAKPTFAAEDGDWVVTSLFGALPPE